MKYVGRGDRGSLNRTYIYNYIETNYFFGKIYQIKGWLMKIAWSLTLTLFFPVNKTYIFKVLLVRFC